MQVIWRKKAKKSYQELDTGDTFKIPETHGLFIKTDIPNYENDSKTFEAISLTNGASVAVAHDVTVVVVNAKVYAEEQ